MILMVDHIQENDDGKRYGMGSDPAIDIADTIFEGMNTGDLYRALQREYGRCISKVYNDYLHKDSKFGPYHIGWVFQRREQYDDCKDTFLHEVWVTLAEKDETVRTIQYHNLGR